MTEISAASPDIKTPEITLETTNGGRVTSALAAAEHRRTETVRHRSTAQRPIRILHVLRAMNRGGIETWLMHTLRNIDRERFQMEFLVGNARALRLRRGNPELWVSDHPDGASQSAAPLAGRP